MDTQTQAFRSLNDKILKAIQTHQEDLMSVIENITQDIGDSLFRVVGPLDQEVDPDELQEANEAIELDEDEEKEMNQDPEYRQILRALTATYVTSFMTQQVPDPMSIKDMVIDLWNRGNNDGVVYRRIKKNIHH